MPEPNAPLRQQLKLIAGGNLANVASHPRLISELRGSIAHSIRLAPPDLTPDVPLRSYNCFEFAFGLAGDPDVAQISRLLPSTCCNTDFAAYLIDTAVLAPISAPSAGDLVLYRDFQCFMHAGVVQPGSILSKWGVGHLWLHGLWEVPAIYGDTTGFFRVRVGSNVAGRFLRFARQREGAIVDEVLHTA